jgi:hypothetical protein
VDSVEAQVTPIILDVRQDLDNDGWEDAEGTVHYDSTVATPFGLLGELRTLDAGESGIDIIQADEVILVRHGFPTAWSKNVQGVSIDTTFTGIQIMTVKASNGEVRYQLDPRPVEWSDKPDEEIPFYVGIRIGTNWTVGKR